MSIRMLALALMAGVSLAIAAPPKSAPPKADPQNDAPPADTIDVDAMARAKDTDASQAANDTATPAPEEAAAPAAPSETPAESTAASPAAAEAAPAATTSESSAAAATVDASPATAPTAAPETAAPAAGEPTPGEAPAPDADSAAKSIAAGCASRAANMLDEAEKADYGNATRDFDAKMRTDMPPPKFKQQWESLSQFGKLVARGQSHLGSGQGYTIVMIPLIFEKTNLVAQIACGSDGRIAGFHVTRAPKPQF